MVYDLGFAIECRECISRRKQQGHNWSEGLLVEDLPKHKHIPKPTKEEILTAKILELDKANEWLTKRISLIKEGLIDYGEHKAACQRTYAGDEWNCSCGLALLRRQCSSV